MKSNGLDPDQDACGFVLAGGLSSRMGTDKALVEFGGEPLIERSISILQGAGLRVLIAGARSSLEAFAPVVPDAEPGLGPLGGICAALRSSRAKHAVFVAVDQPRLPSSLFACLLRHALATGQGITLATVNAVPQTFPAVLDRLTLTILERELAAGRRGCYAAFKSAAAALGQSMAQLPVELLVQSGQIAHPDALPPAYWFLNVNTRADLGHAQAIFRG